MPRQLLRRKPPKPPSRWANDRNDGRNPEKSWISKSWLCMIQRSSIPVADRYSAWSSVPVFQICRADVDDGRYLAERTSATENAWRTRLLDRPKIITNHNVWGFQNKEIYCTWFFFLKLISCIWSWDPEKPLICKSLVTVLFLSIYPSFCPLLFTHRSILKWHNFHCSVDYCGC